ncbi:MAG: DegV family protein [Acidimicrobiia bacterium]
MIHIVTDSSCDLPADLVEQHRITVVPLTIRFGDEELLDGRDLDASAFWARLRSSGPLPETSAPTAGRFEDAFTALGDQRAKGAVAVCMSAELSATYQAAVIAAERLADRFPVRVVDSRGVSMAMGLQVLEAAEQAAQGVDLDQVASTAQVAAARTNLYAALHTLEYLKRGGRIGGAQALLGGILKVKPLITFRDGVVAAAGRVRTRAKAIGALVDRARELQPRLRWLAVVHGQATDLDLLLDPVSELVPAERLVVAELGPVVGTHTGPGALGIAYLLE